MLIVCLRKGKSYLKWQIPQVQRSLQYLASAKIVLKKDSLLSSLCEQLQSLSLEKDRLKIQIQGFKVSSNSDKQTQLFSWSNIQTDKGTRFNTGITYISMFNFMFTWIKPCLPNIVFWRGSKHNFASRVSHTDSLWKVSVLVGTNATKAIACPKVHVPSFVHLGLNF